MDALSIHDSMVKLQEMFTQRMDAYENELKAASSSPSSNVSVSNSKAADFESFRSLIVTALQTLEKQVAILARQIDAIEMRSRRKMLMCHGVPEQEDEDPAAVIANTVVAHLKLQGFSTKDISRCHRMGRTAGVDKPRPILFKCRDLELRDKIWFAKTALKGSGITLSEFLTKSRHDVFMAARQKFGVNKCFTQQGTVVVIGADGKRVRVTSAADLDKISVPCSKPAAARVAPAQKPKSKRAAASSKK